MKGGRREGRKGGREGEQGLWSLTNIPVSSPKLPSFRSHFFRNRFTIGFLRLLLRAPGATVAFAVIGSLSPSPTPQQHRHHLHIQRLPNLSVIQDLLIDKALVYLAGA